MGTHHCWGAPVPVSSRLRSRLDALIASHDRAAHLAADPVRFVHRYEAPGDREVAGLVASALAFGTVTTVGASVARVLDALGPSPAATVDRCAERSLARRLDGFVHRVYRGSDVARMLARAGRLRRAHGSLGQAMRRDLEDASFDLREGLARFADALRGSSPRRGTAHLVPDPRAGSACKRLLLYMRWMVRADDGVDVGLWPLPPSCLLVPVDTHVLRISRNLGLTARATASWKVAEEITSVFRRFDPTDPVKYDFALCHMGVSRQCPSRRDPDKCARCVLKPACRQWSA